MPRGVGYSGPGQRKGRTIKTRKKRKQSGDTSPKKQGSKKR